ncbi:MAG: FtsQ-type POTRA domain-containing protein [Syntrophorhabdaceae bacterium]|nr:FtsQ-type POTRA domain-containing protein [Syntrophorhabdaceae bacterium]
MIEYKAYHKTAYGKRGGGRHAVSKKGKAKESEKMTPKARLKTAAYIFAALFVLVFLGVASRYAYLRLARSAMFSIRAIEMNSCPNVTKEDVWSIVRGDGKNSVLSVSARNLSSRLMSHPWIRSVAVRKSFPDRLVVRIEEHHPIAMVNLDTLWYVNGMGVLFKRLNAYDPKDLAIVTGFSADDLRSKNAVTMRNFRGALELLQLAEAGPLRKNLSEVHFDAQEGYTLVSRDTGVQFKVGGMDFQRAIQRVEEALPRVSALGKSTGVVDLKTEGRIFVRSGE